MAPHLPSKASDASPPPEGAALSHDGDLLVDPLNREACRDLAQRGISGSFAYVILWLSIAYGTPIQQYLPMLAATLWIPLGLLGFWRYWLARRFDATFDASPRRWLRAYTISVLGLSACYALGSSLVMHAAASSWFAYLMLASVAGVLAGGTISVSTHLPLQRAFILITLLPPGIACLVHGDATTYGTAGLAMLYAVYLFIFGHHLHRHYWRSLNGAQLLSVRAQELEEARMRAAKMARSKSEFLANMSHELRTPLNAILGFAQIMNRSETLSEQDRANLETINRSGEHLLNLINQVLDMAKIEAGRLTYEPRPCDLSALLEDLRKMFALKTARKGLSLHFSQGDLPAYIGVDELKLRQVLINLLDNAIKFTPEGQVTLRVAICAEASAEVDEDYVCIEFAVTDTGPGISPDEQERLFQAFNQTLVGREAREGTGLGLALSQRFVEMMHGRIDVESCPGNGSTFRFVIRVPRVAPPEAPLCTTAISLAPGQTRHRILIVDDQRDNRALLVQLHAYFDFELREAANGEEAIAIWREFRPHLIWMDLRMPVMDGYQATRRIRELEGIHADLGHTWIIAITASALHTDEDAVQVRGLDAMVSKPFKESEILQMLKDCLGLRFSYEDPPEPAGPTLEGLDWPAALARHPSAWREALSAAVHAVDFEETDYLIRQIEPRDASLAAYLHTCLQNYRFDRLQQLLAETAV